MSNLALSTGVSQIGEEGNEGKEVQGSEEESVRKRKHLPAVRNTICTVRGTLYAYTRLFSSEPDAKVVTWSNHCARGTWRGFSRGSHGRDRVDDASQVTKEGSCCAVMKSICENVSAGPAMVSEGGTGTGGVPSWRVVGIA
jgi:hypothetical protein